VCGIIVVVAKFADPSIRESIKYDLHRLWIKVTCTKGRKEVTEGKTKPIFSFLNSAYNVDYVYLILMSINNFMEIRTREVAKRDKDSVSVTPQKETKVTFNGVHFENIESWKVLRKVSTRRRNMVINAESMSEENHPLTRSSIR
jgi:hypothetical protein